MTSHSASASGHRHLVRSGRAVSIDHAEDWENGSRKSTYSHRESPWSEKNIGIAADALVRDMGMSAADARRAVSLVICAWEATGAR